MVSGGTEQNKPKTVQKPNNWGGNGDVSIGPFWTLEGVGRLSAGLCNQQPKHNHQGDKQEETRQELLVHVLGCPRGGCLEDLTAIIKRCTSERL